MIPGSTEVTCCILHQSDLDQIQIELSPSPDWEAAGAPTMATGAQLEKSERKLDAL